MSQHEQLSTKRVATDTFPLSWVDVSMVLVTVIWGINFTVVKQTLAEMSPMVFASLRFALAALFMTLVVVGRGESLRVDRADLWRLLLAGLLGITACQAFFIQGIARTTASNAALLTATNPLFITVLSALFHIEPVGRRAAVGVGLSFAGVALIIGAGPDGLSLTSETFKGNLITLLAPLCWSFYMIVLKPLMRRYSPLKLTALNMLMGTPLLLVLSTGDIVNQQWAAITWRGWLGLCYSFVLATAVAFAVWNNSVHRAGHTRTAVFSNLNPAVAVVISWLFLGETLSFWQGIGGIVTLIGVTLTRLGLRNARKRDNARTTP